MEKEIQIIRKATEAAKAKHPQFPNDLFAQISILAEEMGEVAQAANDLVFENIGSRDRILEEVADVAAVCVRMLEDAKPEKAPRNTEKDYLCPNAKG